MTQQQKEIAQVHHYSIYQGTGADKRWVTQINNPQTGKRGKITAKTESEIYQKLYDFYFTKTLPSIRNTYQEWLKYRLSVCSKTNTVHRQETDFKKYYLNEPLSSSLIDTPIPNLTRKDIKLWGCQLIKKYDLTYKNFANIYGIFKQICSFLTDSDKIPKNIASEVHFERTLFRTVSKAPADSQIFYQDEMQAIYTKCCEKADETNDESYLAIPLMQYLGVRIGECLGLSFSDFNKDTNSVYIHCTFCVDDKRDGSTQWETRSYAFKESLKDALDKHKLLLLSA